MSYIVRHVKGEGEGGGGGEASAILPHSNVPIGFLSPSLPKGAAGGGREPHIANWRSQGPPGGKRTMKGSAEVEEGEGGGPLTSPTFDRYCIIASSLASQSGLDTETGAARGLALSTGRLQGFPYRRAKKSWRRRRRRRRGALFSDAVVLV